MTYLKCHSNFPGAYELRYISACDLCGSRLDHDINSEWDIYTMKWTEQIDGIAQGGENAIANALELPQSCVNSLWPSDT